MGSPGFVLVKRPVMRFPSCWCGLISVRSTRLGVNRDAGTLADGQEPPFHPQESSDDADAYVGLTVEEAQRRAEAYGWVNLRTLTSEDQLITMEWVSHRINFLVIGGRISKCWFH
jgi:hypothetical protein